MVRLVRLLALAALAVPVGTTITAPAACAANGNETAPRASPDPKGGPLETAPPNVPEFKPAFPGQTRAPAVVTKTPIDVAARMKSTATGKSVSCNAVRCPKIETSPPIGITENAMKAGTTEMTGAAR